MKKNIGANHSSNQQNPNKGTNGVNQAFAKVQGNKGKHLNPNQGVKKGK